MNFDLAFLAIYLVALLIAASFHEMMHALVAYKLGDDLAHSHGRISLNPLTHIDPILTVGLPLFMVALGQSPIYAAKPVPINTSRIKGEEFGLAVVGLAGPFTNFVLAIIGALVIGLVPGGIIFDFVRVFIQVNIGLCVFNLLPIPPLDGSRLLYALAPDGVRDIMRQIESMGIFGLIMILFLLRGAIEPILDFGYSIVSSIVGSAIIF